jgi:hypothetical protein
MVKLFLCLIQYHAMMMWFTKQTFKGELSSILIELSPVGNSNELTGSGTVILLVSVLAVRWIKNFMKYETILGI